MGLTGLPPGQYYPSAQEFYLDFPVSPRPLDSHQGSPLSCYTQTCAVQPYEQTHASRRARSQGLVTDGPVQAVRFFQQPLLLAALQHPGALTLVFTARAVVPRAIPARYPTIAGGQVNKGVPH